MSFFLFERQQRVVLNGQESESLTIKAGMPRGWILHPLFCLIYINDLLNNLDSNVKLFPDDTLMFPVVRDPISTSKKLNNDFAEVGF